MDLCKWRTIGATSISWFLRQSLRAFGLAIACSFPAVGFGACPIPGHLTWSPDPVFEGDDLDIRVLQFNAVFLNDGSIEFPSPNAILIRTASTSNFGVVPPFATQTLRVNGINAGIYTVTWSHIWTSGGPSANPCPSVVATIEVENDELGPGLSSHPVPHISRLGLTVMIVLFLGVAFLQRARRLL